ncbi:unnamed protein product [Adineta ricciae]|uniref:Uncharacterized protein n=1 Tax=Adineta ricciae TaxID=249248 RepID=A0A813VMK6_ADIRI|nr:unnamed protein product [Adineta ricciae]CAF1512716.1 unnamed protein product [Adineta ricciae]
MECRLVLNNCSEFDIPNSDLLGRLQQQLKYYKFRRVQTKAGKSLFYLFFRKEEETYYALRAGKNIKDISLVRYRHHSVIPAPLHRPDEISPAESYYRPMPSRRVVDAVRYNFSRYIEKFSDKNIFQLFVKRLSEQIVAQRIQITEVYERNCKVNHWWWLNPDYNINNPQNVQKLLDIYFV